MENKILKIAGVQSLFLLLGCVIIMGYVHNHRGATVQANSSELRTNSSNFKQLDNVYTVAIDPGHGGVDSGTLGINERFEEKEFNLAVAKWVKKKLDKQTGIKVLLSREDDKYLSPEERTEWMNDLKADICISIHCNSADNLDATGVEVLYQKGAKGKMSKKLANTCLDSILEKTRQVDRGLLEGDGIYIVRNAKMPIALIEIGFISNEQELAYLRDEGNQELIADGIVNAIKQMKGMDKKK